MEEIVIFTDGGSRGNPGPAAVGVYIETLGKKIGECIGNKTNNDAEYEALILGLQNDVTRPWLRISMKYRKIISHL